MNHSSWAPLTFPPDGPQPPIAPVLCFEQAVPAQRVPRQQNFTYHSHADTQSTSDTHSTPLHYGFPSAEQHTAIDILQGIPIPTILAWLEGFRSLHRGEQYFNPSHLSHQQRHAVSTLINCSNELVQTWVNNARSSGKYWQSM